MSLRTTLLLTVGWIVLGCGGSLGVLYRIHSTTPGGLKPERASALGGTVGVAVAIVAALIWVPYLLKLQRERRQAQEDDREPPRKKKRRPDRDD